MITDAHDLAIRKFIAAKARSVLPTFEVFPSGVDFTGKEAFWSNTGAGLTTQKALETTLINAVWVDWLDFTDQSNNPNIDNTGEDECPIETEIYQLTIFCEASNARLNESSLDISERRILSVDTRIQSAIRSIRNEFRGVTHIDLDAVDETEFAFSESNSVYSQEYVEPKAVCDFIPSKIGRQKKLIVPIKIQIKLQPD